MPVRTGIVGCGNVAGRHARALAEIDEAELVAVCDLDSGRALELAGEHGARVARDADGLFAAGDVEAVVLCLPPAVHAAVGQRALEAGMHVLVEKPIDLDPAAAARLVRRARDTARVLSVVAQQRFHDDVRWLKGVLATGALGRPVLVDATSLWRRDQAYYDAAPGRGRHDAAEGGVLLNQAVHAADLLLWLCGPARAVQARLATLTHEMAAEDTAQVLVDLEHGLATLVASTSVSHQVPERIELRCERGSATLVGGRVTELRCDAELTPPSARPGFAAADTPELFRRTHRDFARAVRGQRERGSDGAGPLVAPEEAVAVVELLRAAAESHAAGRPRELPPTFTDIGLESPCASPSST